MNWFLIKEQKANDWGKNVDFACLRCGKKISGWIGEEGEMKKADYDKFFSDLHFTEFLNGDGDKLKELSEPSCKYAGKDKRVYDNVFIVNNEKNIKG